MSRKLSGQNITELALIIALIAIVCVLVFMNLGKNITEMLASSDTKVENYKPFGVRYDKEGGFRVYFGGDLGGTASSPKSECSGKSCIIDYGDFILTGIPSNFGELVETSGTSAGTDSLIDIMASIGNQIVDADTGDGNSAEDFKLIAEFGYFMSDLQQESEKAAKACAGDADPVACFQQKNLDYKSTPLQAPADLKKYLTSWPNMCDDLQGVIQRCNLGWGANAGLPASYTKINISQNIMNAYDRIMTANTGDGVTTEMKQIATELIRQIDTLNDNMYRVHKNLSGSTVNYANYDPINGKLVWDNGKDFPSDINDMYKPDTSTNTDIRAKIFCATGNGKDIGATCK